MQSFYGLFLLILCSRNIKLSYDLYFGDFGARVELYSNKLCVHKCA
jgi:hypothetical protein